MATFIKENSHESYIFVPFKGHFLNKKTIRQKVGAKGHPKAEKKNSSLIIP